jgi:hypothetical protein
MHTYNTSWRYVAPSPLRALSDAISLRLFLFSLLVRAKQWFYANREAVNTWDNCANAFLKKFFPIGTTNALRGKIFGFQQ